MGKRSKSPPKHLSLENAFFLGSSWEPNGIRAVADAYLDAAQTVFDREQSKTGFLETQAWFVVHHLSYISSELYLKSFAAWNMYPSGISPHPDEESYEVPLYKNSKNAVTGNEETSQGTLILEGHGGIFEKLAIDTQHHLKEALSPAQICLIENMNISEFNRGRYPYETIESDSVSEVFPSGDEGRKLSVDWLLLAKSLSDFRISVEVPE